jgi:hypothetical protein
MLIPEQSTTLLGAELVVTGLLGGVMLLRLHRPSRRVEQGDTVGMAARKLRSERHRRPSDGARRGYADR